MSTDAWLTAEAEVQQLRAENELLRSALTRIMNVDRLPACARNIGRDALAGIDRTADR